MRTNDLDYLAHVARLYREIALQLRGLLWKDGGPVIGAQLENEYSLHGPGMGAEHILKLKELAVKAGIDVPLYSVTGWPSLDFPPHEVIPISGGYPDGFWFGSLTNLPPSMNYLFNLNRELGDMGATVPSEDPTGKVDLKHDPYFGAEEAGGMESSYHRRPLLKPDDIAALTLTGIGSGLNLYGYYMFHGGANPLGKLTTLQESQATGSRMTCRSSTTIFRRRSASTVRCTSPTARQSSSTSFSMRTAPTSRRWFPSDPSMFPKTPVIRPYLALRFAPAAKPGSIFVNNYIRQFSMPERAGFQVPAQASGQADICSPGHL